MHLTVRKDTCLMNTNKWTRFCICCGNNMGQGNEGLIVHAMATKCVRRQRDVCTCYDNKQVSKCSEEAIVHCIFTVYVKAMGEL